ncbi:unnamed protein product [Rhodiola kirilowii]
MGIKDLLRFMKPYVEPIHIKKYAGKRVGIDAYSWLHKGAYSCSMELCLDLNGEKKLRYLQYFMHRIKLLQHYKIIPVVVFDGGNLPCKSRTEEERKRKRTANLDLAMSKYKEGSIAAATEHFQRAVSITPVMADKIIQILKSENVEFVVAPYEADAQLAFLSSTDEEEGGVAAVITEDSDLLAYGMCVLAGCDFLPSVPGIGMVKAHALISKYRNIERVLAVLKLEKGNQMAEHYVESYREALAVFQHAQIYDAGMKMLRHMKPLPEDLLKTLNGKLDFLGPYPLTRIELPQSTIIAIAEGKLNPLTMKIFDDRTNVFPNEYLSLKVPDNTPFKKRAVCEVQLPLESQINIEQNSEVTEVDYEDVVCLTENMDVKLLKALVSYKKQEE